MYLIDTLHNPFMPTNCEKIKKKLFLMKFIIFLAILRKKSIKKYYFKLIKFLLIMYNYSSDQLSSASSADIPIFAFAFLLLMRICLM